MKLAKLIKVPPNISTQQCTVDNARDKIFRPSARARLKVKFRNTAETRKVAERMETICAAVERSKRAK